MQKTRRSARHWEMLRIPDDADRRSGSWQSALPINGDQRSGMMPIQRIRDDRDQLISIPGRAITMPGKVIAISRNVFHRGRRRWTSHQANCFDSTYGRDRVSARRLSMRKTKEVHHLRFDLGLGQRAIAGACSISQSTVERRSRSHQAHLEWTPRALCTGRSRPDQTPLVKGPGTVRATVDCLALLLEHKWWAANSFAL